MDKADFMGRLFLIDDWTSFDNSRFAIIRANSDGIKEITADELNAMANVKAILMDENWFQVYDNNNKMTQKYVASGLYWNYFYHTWKTVSYSPFANAIAFTTDKVEAPANVTATVSGKDTSDVATVLTLESPEGVKFNQTDALTKAGIGIQKYGAVIIPKTQDSTDITLTADYEGNTYTAGTAINASTDVGTAITLSK